MTTQAPHIIRAAVALVAELPEHMIRIISPDIGGGFGNKVPVYPGYVCSILASILLERPVKWIEDKTGNLISTGFARDVYLDGEMALRQRRQDPRRPDAHRRRPRRVLLRRPAEQVQDRADALGLRRLRHPGRAPDRPRHLHQQGARRGRLPVLVPGHRGDVLPGADGPGGRRRPGHGPGRVPPDELRPGRRVPAPHPVRLPDRLRPVRQVPGRRPEGGRLRGLPAAAGRRPGRAAGCSASASPR